MELDPVLSVIMGVTLIVFLVGIGLRLLHQPHVVGYIVAGVVIGASGLNLVQNSEIVSNLGSLGIVLLMFFIGMHISIPKLFKNWHVAILGTVIQICATVGMMFLLAYIFNWPAHLAVLFGFVVSLSSTAVVLKMLEEWGELNTKVGQNVVSILLVQDIAIIPMIVILEFFGNAEAQSGQVLLSIIGGLLFLDLVLTVLRRGHIQLPFTSIIPKDKEIQVLLALAICFGLSIFGVLFGLSAALGAFVAGVIVSAARQTQWVHHVLEPFRVVFVALFFVYVGLVIDVPFIWQNLGMIAGLVLLVFLVNTLTNALILRFLGDRWPESIYGGALLSEIGEFSFLIGLIGWHAGLLTEFSYHLLISIIALTLLLGPFWIVVTKKLLLRSGHSVA